MGFPSLKPPPPFDKSHMMMRYYYAVVLPYRLRRWYRDEVMPLFCEHKKTYVANDWSFTHLRCSKCHKTLRDLRKDPLHASER